MPDQLNVSMLPKGVPGKMHDVSQDVAFEFRELARRSHEACHICEYRERPLSVERRSRRPRKGLHERAPVRTAISGEALPSSEMKWKALGKSLGMCHE